MTLATSGLAFLAGLLSILSPCVLPLLPIVLGAAASEHRFGPALLALGVSISFVAIGLFVATIGFGVGLDGGVFRAVAAVLMILVGLVLAVPALQIRVAALAGPLADKIDSAFGGGPGNGLWGQFGVGALLGAVWSPCVGPTLGAASVVAARGENLGQVALTMGVFGVGAALPLLGLGAVSRGAMIAWRSRMLGFAAYAKQALGVLLLVLGASILTGLDKRLEAALVDASPEWLTQLTTRF